MKKPLISIILPVYNGEQFLSQSIQSILNQSYPNLELLIINDGSSDRSQSIISGFTDSRIRSYKHPKNRGLVATLNHGLALARGEFVARMDQDDISLPHRLATQQTFLVKHPGIAVVGCLTMAIDENHQPIAIQPVPLTPEGIQFGLSIKNCFIHGSIMMRKDHIPRTDRLYSERCRHAEDYEFWVRLRDLGLGLANTSDVLYLWRSHRSSISKVSQPQQLDSFGQLFTEQQPFRERVGFQQVWSLFKWYRMAPRTAVFDNTEYDTFFLRDFQYLLGTWAVSVFRRRPWVACLSIILAIWLDPLRLIRKKV